MTARALRATALAAAAGAWVVAAHTAVNAALLRRPPRVAVDGGAPTVSVCVPARDEAERIGACVRAVLAGRGVDLELVVVDDRSSDGTATAARAAADGDARLRVIDGRPPPPGWLGKPHACQQAAEAAGGEVLVFCDADVVLAPDGLARTVAALEAGWLDLVCPYPRQLADGVGPRLVQPLLQWSWLALLPLRAAERWPRPSLVAANGQLAACRAGDYHAVGGHGAARGAVLDDIALGRAFVRAGLRAGVVDGTDVATCRMYADWTGVRDGYAKSLWAAFGSPAGAAAAMALLGWLFVWPAAAAVAGAARGDRRLAALGAAGWAGGAASRAVAARRTRGRAADAAWHPASVAALAWLTLRSWRLRRRGALTWRGRGVVA